VKDITGGWCAFYTDERSHVNQNCSRRSHHRGMSLTMSCWVIGHHIQGICAVHGSQHPSLGQWEAAARGRESKNSRLIRRSTEETIRRSWVWASVIQPEVDTDDKSFPTWRPCVINFSSDLMAYTLAGSGYRAGGSNQDCMIFQYSCQFQPTRPKIMNRFKGDALDRSVTFDARFTTFD